MKLLRHRDIPADKYTNAFLGFGPENTHCVIELTYNYGVEKYNLGTAFGYFGIAVEDLKAAVDTVKAKGGQVVSEGNLPGQTKPSAVVEDPDGYKFALIESGPVPDPFALIMLNVLDLDRAITFYEKAFGMRLVSSDSFPEEKVSIAYLGYGSDEKTTLLGLTSNHGVTEYERGNAYAQIAVGTDDVYKTAAILKEFDGKVTREPGPLPGINTKITAVLDPEGWKTVFVDNADFLEELP
ncbi:hypothetical protein KP509_31G063600 [Ceratopteris richardii]|nr:hypothetical protein KP509_31G063600 [Ceratopteris richardii]